MTWPGLRGVRKKRHMRPGAGNTQAGVPEPEVTDTPAPNCPRICGCMALPTDLRQWPNLYEWPQTTPCLSAVCRAGPAALFGSEVYGHIGTRVIPTAGEESVSNGAVVENHAYTGNPSRHYGCCTISCTPWHSHTQPRHRVPPRYGATGCTWPYGRNATWNRS